MRTLDRTFSRALGALFLSALLGSTAVRAQSPAANRTLEISLRGGIGVTTIQTDGSALTGFVPGASIAFRDRLLLVAAEFDSDPRTSADASQQSGERRTGFHAGASVGASFPFARSGRFDLNAEVGLHRIDDTLSSTSVSFATGATLPYFGVRPAISTWLGTGKTKLALGAALFFRVDAGQRQPLGLPDDGGHELGAELFLSLRIPILN